MSSGIIAVNVTHGGGGFEKELLVDHFGEIAQIIEIDEFSESGHAVFGAVVPGVDEILLAAILREAGSTVCLLECNAGKFPDCEYGGVVVIGKGVALKATQSSIRVVLQRPR